MFLKDLSCYADINEVYVSKLAKINPPVRVCTEIPINFHVILDALAYKKIEDNEKNDKKIHNRHTMHVQSISNWAPANIGPYSQAVRVSFYVFFFLWINCFDKQYCKIYMYFLIKIFYSR